MQIHIDRNGQRFGPYTVEELNTYLIGGQVLPTDRAWYDGLPDWGPVQNIPGVQMPAAAAPVPPAPPTASTPPTPPAPGTPPPAPGTAPGVPAAPKKPVAATLEEDLSEERLDDIIKREQDLEADTCIFNGGVFFVKNPWILLLGAWMAIPLALLSMALIVPGGPMLAGIFNFFLQKKRMRRIGLSAMFVGFSNKFVNLMLAFLVTGAIVALSPLIGVLILWGALFGFDPFVVGREIDGLINMLGVALGALTDISQGKSPSDMLAYLMAAVSTVSSLIGALLASLGALPFLNKLIAMLGGVLTVVLPLFLAANWIFTLPLCTHYNLPYGQAMQLSTKLVSNDRQGFIFFILYAISLCLMGPLLMFLGYLKLPLVVPGVIIVFMGWLWMMVAAFNTNEKLGYMVSAPVAIGILQIVLMILAKVLDLEFLLTIAEVLSLLCPAVAAIVGVLFLVQNLKQGAAPFILSLIGAGAIAVDVALYPVGVDTDPATRVTVVQASSVLLYILGALISILMPAVSLTAYAVAYDQFCGRARKMEEQPQWILTIMLIFGILGFLGLIYLAITTLLSGYT